MVDLASSSFHVASDHARLGLLIARPSSHVMRTLTRASCPRSRETIGTRFGTMPTTVIVAPPPNPGEWITVPIFGV
jgi:hypothetical protein